MKKCFVMFVFFVVMLLIAALMDNTEIMISENKVAGYADAESILSNDELENNTKNK